MRVSRKKKKKKKEGLGRGGRKRVTWRKKRRLNRDRE